MNDADLRQRIDRLAHGYREAQILFTALRLGLFEAVAGEEHTAETLAARLGSSPRGTRILADALAALDLLVKRDGRYRLGPSAGEVLLPDGPSSRRSSLLHGARQFERWAKLFDAVVTGEPVPDTAVDPRLTGGARAFAAAMRDVGRESAVRLADRLDLDGVERFLDVGGGPGAYALELARRRPELRAVVFDQPETVAVAREHAAAAGLADRVTARAGDAFIDELGGPYDLVLVSNLLHIYGEEANRGLVARCAHVLAPGGRLCLKDFFLDEDAISPAGGALFAVNMLVSTEAGEAYTAAQATAWLEAAGLVVEPMLELTVQSRVLVGRRAG